MRARIYVCHTFYHVYVACLKELNLPKEERGKADMVLSTMSCDFGNLSGRLAASGLFGKVFIFTAVTGLHVEDRYFKPLCGNHRQA